MCDEPWYGVRLVYRHVHANGHAFEERVLIVRAEDFDSAIARAERISRDDYENESTIYTNYAMAFHIFDENGDALGDGVDVFSLIRNSELPVDDYLNRFHDTGNECVHKSDDPYRKSI
jgi:hypothetical protein